MAERDFEIESLLRRADELERSYDWRGAAEAYSHAARSLPQKDSLRICNIEEAKAQALHRHAFQAKTNQEFRKRVDEAIQQYRDAKEAYDKLEKDASTAWAYRCDAMIAYLGFWPEGNPAEKRRKIGEAWDKAKDAMDAFERAGDHVQFVRTNNILTFAVSIGYACSADPEFREKLLREALEFSERAVKLAHGVEDKADVSRAHIVASYYRRLICSDFIDADHKEEWDRISGEHWVAGWKLSKEGSLDAITFNHKFGILPSVASDDEREKLITEVFEYAASTGDCLRLASALEWKENAAYLKAYEAVDPEQRDSAAREALSYTEQSQQCYAIASEVYISEAIWWSGSPQSGFYSLMASLETNPKKKRGFAEKGVNAFENGLRVAKESDYPEGILAVCTDATLILTNLARTEENPESKKRILERALSYAQQQVDLGRILHPMDFGIADSMVSLADTEHELADLAVDINEKTDLCRKAITHMSEAYEALIDRTRFTSATVRQWIRVRQAEIQYLVACWMLQLHKISGDKSSLTDALTSFLRSADYYTTAEQPSRAAESYWRAAQTEDTLGNFLGASERFESASKSFKASAERLPRLVDLYRDYDIYMQAWSQIELAKHHHSRQRAEAASECYEKASKLHESTEKWRFLVPNYRAWAEVERGEGLSRKERSREAMAAFETAARLFAESKESLRGHAHVPVDEDEKQNAASLAKAADLRNEFCKGRLALEEAKILDRQGDELGSSEKFALAAATFEKLSALMDSDQDRSETQLIMTLAKAWETMTRADAESSSELFERAALMFEQAKDLSVGETAKQLALGHSRFCKALAAGTRFADTGDLSIHDAAIQNLETAAMHYMKAGLENDSEYAKASKLLFDAYVYMGKANREEDQSKKAKLYAMTEKVLEASAAAYSKADYPKKKDQVLKLFEKVKGERELAVALTEVLKAPDVVASTTALPSPSPTQETASGMQRFEHADIQAVMIARPSELQVGQELGIDIELVNAGRGFAQLIRIEEVIPDEFVVVREPEHCRMQDRGVSLRGRRLDALKTEDLRLVVKSTAKGSFSLRPRVVYLDETGEHRSCSPAPINVSVREMGLSGWLKGV